MVERGSGGGVPLSLSCESFVNGTWREGSLAGDPKEHIKMALEMGISFHGAPYGEHRGGPIYWGL
jgi:hypothetical protein